MITGRLDKRRITNSDRLANLRYVKSSNVDFIGWPIDGEPLMIVRFKSGGLYGYMPVSRQQCVAAASAPSVGKYLHQRIFGVKKVVQIHET